MSDAIITTDTKWIIRIRKVESINSLLLLALSFMLYGQNLYLDFFLSAIIFGVFLLNINKDVFFFYYFAIIFFEPVLALPFELGSVFRVYQLLFIAKILADAKKKALFTFPPIHKILLVLMLVTWSIFTIQGISTMMTMVINIVIVIYIFSRINTAQRRNDMYSQMLFVMFLFSFLSGIYGLYNGVGIEMGLFSRLSGIIGDPNYSALFYILGIFSLLGTDVISSNRVKILFALIMCVFVLLTVSIAGITGLIILLVLYYLYKDKRLAMLLMVVIIFSVVLLYYLPIESGTLYGIKYRIEFSLASIASGDFASLTSGRYNLNSNYISYFFTQDTSSILLGGQNIIAGTERVYYLDMFGLVSHNSYIDMLYAVGILGTLFILFCFIYDIAGSIKEYKNSKYEHFLAMAFLKLTIMWFCLSISIFPFRYFLTFIML